ncbi:Sphingoid long-chain bases kinase 1 [Platanthera zijinensis]|uniref:Sphingoid long-chain bases kinase 1 n=1 Tax=Platanthera zijinensis TaxID=2320716 RepID=A0AAP0BAV7_9ASPA
MHKSVIHLQYIVSLRVLEQKSFRCMGSRRSQVATGQLSSPIVFPEKRGKIKSLDQNKNDSVDKDPHQTKSHEHRVDINELSNLLGCDVISGKLAYVKRSKRTGTNVQFGSENANPASTDAKLTSKALSWGSQTLLLEDVVSVSYSAGLRYFDLHAYPLRKISGGLSCIFKPKRSQKDLRFVASTPEEAIKWVAGFADQQCFVKCSPHPMSSSKKKPAEDLVASNLLIDQPFIKCKSPPRILVILNPRSGHGRSSNLFHGTVQPIFEVCFVEVALDSFSTISRKIL